MPPAAVKVVRGYGWPTIPLASAAGEDTVGCGTALIEILRAFSAACAAGVVLSTTLNFGVTVCMLVGLPLITPVGLKASPLGSDGEPLARLQAYPGFPPEAAKVVLYGMPMLPLGSGESETIVSAPGSGGGAGAVDTSLQEVSTERKRANGNKVLRRGSLRSWDV